MAMSCNVQHAAFEFNPVSTQRNTKNAGTCLQNIEQLVKPVCKDLPKYAHNINNYLSAIEKKMILKKYYKKRIEKVSIPVESSDF